MRFLHPPKIVRRFGKDKDGVTAIEFAMLALPFFTLLMAIIETSLLFFAGQVLESAADDIGRKIRTGQLQPPTAQHLKTEVCKRSSVLFNCDKILVDMKVVTRFSELGSAPRPKNGKLDPAHFKFQTAGAQEIVMLTIVTEWPVFTNYLQKFLSDLNNKNAVLTAVTVFRTEPFS